MKTVEWSINEALNPVVCRPSPITVSVSSTLSVFIMTQEESEMLRPSENRSLCLKQEHLHWPGKNSHLSLFQPTTFAHRVTEVSCMYCSVMMLIRCQKQWHQTALPAGGDGTTAGRHWWFYFSGCCKYKSSKWALCFIHQILIQKTKRTQEWTFKLTNSKQNSKLHLQYFLVFCAFNCMSLGG